jgi:hypothetical protein
MVVMVLKNGTAFSIETSPDLKWISNEKSVKLIGLEFNRISSWNFQFGLILDKMLVFPPSD